MVLGSMVTIPSQSSVLENIKMFFLMIINSIFTTVGCARERDRMQSLEHTICHVVGKYNFGYNYHLFIFNLTAWSLKDVSFIWYKVTVMEL